MTPNTPVELRFAHFLEFFFDEFGCMPGGIFTESKALVHSGIKRFRKFL